ncbi:hypothetical protein [Rhizobium tubonense]|nr:hypothetical protein [Rhizobium tubonense]
MFKIDGNSLLLFALCSLGGGCSSAYSGLASVREGAEAFVAQTK